MPGTVGLLTRKALLLSSATIALGYAGAAFAAPAAAPAAPLPEAAAAMGVPLGTAKSRLHRATRALRAAIDSDARVRLKLAEGRPR